MVQWLVLSLLRVQVQSLVRELRSQATKCKFASAFSLPRTCGLLLSANYVFTAFAYLPAHLPCSLCSRILDSLNSLNIPTFSPQGFPCKLIPQFGAVCSPPLPSFVQSRLLESLTAIFLGRSFLDLPHPQPSSAPFTCACDITSFSFIISTFASYLSCPLDLSLRRVEILPMLLHTPSQAALTESGLQSTLSQ